jgi:hypothetical protein
LRIGISLISQESICGDIGSRLGMKAQPINYGDVTGDEFREDLPL